MRTAKPCGPDTRGWCQAVGGEFGPTGSIRHQAGSDGGKRNSSPGRARHKPSNHCAGNAGVLRLYLYARVRSLCAICTRDRGCSKHPAFPAPSSSGRMNLQTSGALRREMAETYLSTSSRPSDLSAVARRAKAEARAGTHNHECLCCAMLQLQLHLHQASVAMGPCSRAQLRTRQGRRDNSEQFATTRSCK
jgi:hypothetical protein